MADSTCSSDDEGDYTAGGVGDGAARAPSSAAEQGSALAVTALLLGVSATVAQDQFAGGHHATVWDGARALLALVGADPRRQDALRGRRVLEVGAGTGLLGILLARALGCTVVMTDLPAALPALRANAASTYGGARAACEPLVWGETRPAELRRLFAAAAGGGGAAMEEEHKEEPFDFVIGTDVVFSEGLTPLLVATVAAIAARSDELLAQQRRAVGGATVAPSRRCTVIFANEVRDLRAQAVFERAVAEAGLAPARPLRRRDLPAEWRAAKGQDDVLLVFEMRLGRRRGAAAGASSKAGAADDAGGGGNGGGVDGDEELGALGS